MSRLFRTLIVACVALLLSQPTLVVWGRQDALSPLALGERFKWEIPNSQLVVIDNCGHAPPNECPAEFNRAVTTFISRS